MRSPQKCTLCPRCAPRSSGLLVSELDPDAPSRQRRRLDEQNAKGEEMLAAQLWKLVRAGGR